MTKIIGYQKLETTKNRKKWYQLPNLKPSRIVVPKSMMDTMFIPISREPIIVDHRLYTCENKNPDKLWKYLNSTFFMLVVELFSRRLGGGALDIKVEDYKLMPVPDLDRIDFTYDENQLFSRSPAIYFKEVMEKSKVSLDEAVAKALGFVNAEDVVEQLHKDYVEVVEDRLIKADRPLKRKSSELAEKEEEDDKDN